MGRGLMALVSLLAVVGCDDGEKADEEVCPELVYEGDCTVETPEGLAALGDYTDIGGILYLQCPECEGFGDLACLETVYDRTVIIGNDAVTDLSGLERLASTNESVQISENGSLESLVGLGGLGSIGGPLFVSGNPELTSLDGLEALTSVNGFVQIYDNPKLPYCEICSLIERAGVPLSETYAYNNEVDECWSNEAILICP